jgi:hypothetical protein
VKRIPLILAALLLTGCGTVFRPVIVHRPADLPVNYRYVSLSPDISSDIAMWVRRFEGKVKPGTVFVNTHGGDMGGRWVVGSGLFPPEPMEDFLRRVKNAKGNKGRQIVLLSCNPGGYPLKVPGVWYVRKTLASMPGWGQPGWACGGEGLRLQRRRISHSRCVTPRRGSSALEAFASKGGPYVRADGRPDADARPGDAGAHA